MNAGTCGIEAREREENEKKNAWRGYEEGSDREGEVETEKHFCLEQRECLGGLVIVDVVVFVCVIERENRVKKKSLCVTRRKLLTVLLCPGKCCVSE